MKFKPIEDPIEDNEALTQEYKSAVEAGVIKLGTNCLFFRKSFRIYYIQYKNLARAYRRIMLVPAKMCCATGELPVESFVLHNSKDEEVAMISVPGAKVGVFLINELKQRSPNTILSCPEKPKVKKPGKSAKSKQAIKAKEMKEGEV